MHVDLVVSQNPRKFSPPSARRLPPWHRSRAGATLVGMVEYEYRVLTLPPRLPRADVRALLAAEAEYGQWELSRHRIYMGGMRRVWLRRRIIRVPRPS